MFLLLTKHQYFISFNQNNNSYYDLMKRYLTYILIVSYSLISVNAFVPLLNYAINYNYIIEELCVERDLEVNNCSGSCQLKTQVSKNLETENQNKGQKPIVIKEIETPFFSSIQNSSLIDLVNSYNYSTIQSNVLEIELDKITPPPKSFS